MSRPAVLRIGLWAGALALAMPLIAAAPPRVAPPTLYLTWNAPFGDPRSRTAITTNCRDTTTADTLYLTFETHGRPMRLTGISGALVFEPQKGDTLGRFWFLARGEANSGRIFVDFEGLSSVHADPSWQVPVTGGVGYTHAGGRGRLDLSAHVPPTQTKGLFPDSRFMFARVKLYRSRSALPGCDRPMSVAWLGARFYTNRGEQIWAPPGSDCRVTWNARTAALATGGLRLAVATWVPRFAPPSWQALEAGLAPLKAAKDSTNE